MLMNWMDRLGGAVYAPAALPGISSDKTVQEQTLVKNSKLDGLERILEKHSLENPYRISGPSLMLQYAGLDKRYTLLVKKLKQDLKRYSLSAKLVYPSGVVQISPKDGPGRDLLVEYRSAHYEKFRHESPRERKITHSQTYCTQ